MLCHQRWIHWLRRTLKWSITTNSNSNKPIRFTHLFNPMNKHWSRSIETNVDDEHFLSLLYSSIHSQFLSSCAISPFHFLNCSSIVISTQWTSECVYESVCISDAVNSSLQYTTQRKRRASSSMTTKCSSTGRIPIKKYSERIRSILISLTIKNRIGNRRFYWSMGLRPSLTFVRTKLVDFHSAEKSRILSRVDENAWLLEGIVSPRLTSIRIRRLLLLMYSLMELPQVSPTRYYRTTHLQEEIREGFTRSSMQPMTQSV